MKFCGSLMTKCSTIVLSIFHTAKETVDVSPCTMQRAYWEARSSWTVTVTGGAGEAEGEGEGEEEGCSVTGSSYS